MLYHTDSAVIVFCGHKFHVHPNFSLIITTNTLPTTADEWRTISSLTQFISLVPYFSVGQEILLSSFYSVIFGQEKYDGLCQSLKEERINLIEIERAMLSYLKEQRSVGDVEQLMENKEKVSSFL